MSTSLYAQQLDELIHQRRSIYPQDYTGEKVDDEIVKQILENARWAPTHKFTEPWRFVVFTGDGIKALAKFQADLYKTVTETDGSFKENNYIKLSTKPLLSSHIVAILMKRDEKKSVPEIEESGAVFCAIQNMYLTATAYGVGSYLSTGGITYFEEAKSFFNLQPEDRLIGFFHLGIPKRVYPPARRKPLEEVCQWVTGHQAPKR
jgi:nitroreductase